MTAPDAGSAATTGHDLDVAAVRARVALTTNFGSNVYRDRADLLAEVDRLTRERDAKAVALDYALATLKIVARERDDARRLVGNVEAVCVLYGEMRARNDDVKFGSDATLKAIRAALAGDEGRSSADGGSEGPRGAEGAGSVLEPQNEGPEAQGGTQ